MDENKRKYTCFSTDFAVWYTDFAKSIFLKKLVYNAKCNETGTKGEEEMENVSLRAEERQEVVRYGIERARMELLFLGFIILAGLILDVFWYGLIFWFSFCFLRKSAGGYHADTRKRCGLISATIVVLSFLCIKYVSMNLPIGIFLQLGCYVVIMLLSPVDNINRVLEEGERQIFRRKAQLSATCLFAVSFCFYGTEHLHIVKAVVLAYVVVALSLVSGVLKNKLQRRRV